MKIAIIGAGAAGLTAAHLLESEHDVSVFESENRPGGHAHTVHVKHPSGRPTAVDVGFIVFNEERYPLFTKLLQHLKIESRASDMSFSVRSSVSGFEYCGRNGRVTLGKFVDWFRPRSLVFLTALWRFHREAPQDLATLSGAETVHGYLSRKKFGNSFAEDFFLPLGGALWSSPKQRFGEFPIAFVLNFLAQHGMLQRTRRPEWRTIRGGSQRYVRAISERLGPRLRTSSKIVDVRRNQSGFQVQTAAGELFRCDHVIFACPAFVSLSCFKNPTSQELEFLEKFHFQQNEAVLHHDERLLPRSAKVRASWNYCVDPQNSEQALVTYDLSRLQGLEENPPFLLTLNDQGSIDPAKVLKRFTFSHPQFTTATAEAQKEQTTYASFQGASYIGAWLGYGFHEDAVRSAHIAAAAISGGARK